MNEKIVGKEESTFSRWRMNRGRPNRLLYGLD